MKRIISLISVAIFSILLVTFIVENDVVNVEAGGASGDWVWVNSEYHSDAVIITEYRGNGGHVEIPSKLDGKTVKYVMYGVFHNKNITSVYIPSSIVVLELAKENSETNTTFYVTNAFKGNPNLTNIVTEENGAYVVKNKVLYLDGSNNTSIPEKERGLNVVTNFNPNGGALDPNTVSIYGYAYSNIKVDNITLPEGLVRIYNSAFEKNNLTSVVIPNTVESIGNYAFSLNNITKLTLGNSLDSIGSYAFQNKAENIGVRGITELTLPNSLKTIGDKAFLRQELKSIVIPDSVTTLGSSAFYENQLNSVKIGNGIKRIEDFTFSHNKINELTLGNNVEYIGSNAFQNLVGNKGLYGIKQLTIPQSMKIIDNRGFWGHDIESLVIPGNVTTIGPSAFYNNEIKHLELEQGITSIGDGAFQSNNLRRVDAPASVESFGSQSFAENDMKIFIVRNSNATMGAAMLASNPGYNGKVDIVTYDPSTGKEYADKWSNYRFVSINGTGQILPEVTGYQKGPFDVTLKSSYDRDKAVQYAVISGPYRTPTSEEWINVNETSSMHSSNGQNVSLKHGQWTVVVSGHDYENGTKSQTYRTYMIDENAPTATITQNITEKTHKNIILTVNAKDDYSGLKSIIFNGNDIKSNPSVEVTQNGTYTFTLEDNAGNTRTVTHDVNNIERIMKFNPPNIQSFGKVELGQNIASTNVTPLIIQDWREDSDTWKLNVSATQLKRGSEELPAGLINLKGPSGIKKIEGEDGQFNLNNKKFSIDGNSAMIAEASNSNGEYQITFPSNALEIIIDPSVMKKGTYETTITWEIIVAP